MAENITTGASLFKRYKTQKKLPPLTLDMAVGFASCFAAYSFYCDSYAYISGISDPSGIYNNIKLAVSLFTLLVWLVLNIQNGLAGRTPFLVFTIIFWLAPLSAGLFISAFDIAQLTGAAAKALNIALLFIKIIVQSPSAGVDFANKFLPVSGAMAVCFLTLVYTLAFLIAYIANIIESNKPSVRDEGSDIK